MVFYKNITEELEYSFTVSDEFDAALTVLGLAGDVEDAIGQSAGQVAQCLAQLHPRLVAVHHGTTQYWSVGHAHCLTTLFQK